MKAGGLVRMLIRDEVLTLEVCPSPGQHRCISESISGVTGVLGQRGLSERKLEEAIARTEDIIMPMIPALSGIRELVVSGPELEGIFRLLPEGDAAPVPIQSVELLFNQLADRAGGSVVAWRYEMPPAQVAPGLVILREVMHHGGFSAVSLARPMG